MSNLFMFAHMLVCLYILDIDQINFIQMFVFKLVADFAMLAVLYVVFGEVIAFAGVLFKKLITLLDQEEE